VLKVSELNVLREEIDQLTRINRDQSRQIKELNEEVDKAEKKLHEIEHVLNIMRLGKRRVSLPHFDSKYYIKANPDLLLHKVDPVAHYLFHGYFEKRKAVPPKSFLTLIPQAIAERGGVLKTTVKAISKARREGLSGVKSALGKVRALAPTHNPGGYAEWIEQFDTLSEDKKKIIIQSINNFTHLPLLSVVMPVYNAPPKFLQKAIESVRAQLYPHWELCIADDASTDPNIKKILSEQAALDDRIRLVFREKNGHISAASNSALDIATGEFIVLLDHDDELPAHALYHVAKCLNENPDADLIYSDEDKISGTGNRYDPYFKPDFDPLLFLAQNMISHLGVYRTALVREIGGFRKGFEGSQDWDLALRVVEKTQRDRVLHIPRILYHWRAVEGSTALAVSEKSYVVSAGQLAVSEHLVRTERQAEVVRAPEAPHFNRVIFDRSPMKDLISIIIPTRDRADLLRVCVGSIMEKSTYSNYELIVVDNGSVEDETFSLFDSWSHSSGRFKIIRDDAPFNFSRINNLAAEHAAGKILCFLNNDIEVVTHDWIEEMATFAIQPNVGCVGARLWYPSGKLQHGGVLLGVGGVANHAHYQAEKGCHGYFGRAVLHQEYSAVTAAALMIRADTFKKVNGYDESLAVAFNDIDLCLRVREAGYRNVWTPYAELIHYESLTRGSEDNPEKIARFKGEVEFMKNRWGKLLSCDPSYNPNLNINHEDFSLAWPPRVSLI